MLKYWFKILAESCNTRITIALATTSLETLCPCFTQRKCNLGCSFGLDCALVTSLLQKTLLDRCNTAFVNYRTRGCSTSFYTKLNTWCILLFYLLSNMGNIFCASGVQTKDPFSHTACLFIYLFI